MVDNIIHAVQQVVAGRPSLLLDLEERARLISDAREGEDENGSFIFYDFLMPFLDNATRALDRFVASARGRFSASIASPIKDDDFLPKSDTHCMRAAVKFRSVFH